ncbi:DHHW family protein [Paenibacillus sp. FSL H3-0333]|uniref:DHHW family protein n=1 Tax=Paenibacillus sp. FSL H3-0333 TaxID=2921373 RepID=UPI0030FD1E95
MKKYDQVYYRALAIVLLMFTGAVLVVNCLTPRKVFSESENRMLQQLPTFSLQTLGSGKFTSEFEAYLSDQFMERDFWIGLKSDADQGLGKKESNGVYLGKDGYLIQKFTPPGHEDLADKLKAIQAFDQATPGLRKYMMLVPTAASILEDKLPPYASGGDERGYWDKIKDSDLGDIQCVHVSPALEANKEQPVYYRTDHHWTTQGAFLAYRELGAPMGFTPRNEDDFNIRQVTSQFYGSLYSKSGFRHIRPDAIELYYPKVPETVSVEYAHEQQSADSMYAMENLTKKDKYTVFFNGNHGLLRITTGSAEGRRLLIVKDSYANSLIPFLTPHFSEIDVIDLRYYEGDVLKLMEERQIRDMLILYNMTTFFEDPSIKALADSVK